MDTTGLLKHLYCIAFADDDDDDQIPALWKAAVLTSLWVKLYLPFFFFFLLFLFKWKEKLSLNSKVSLNAKTHQAVICQQSFEDISCQRLTQHRLHNLSQNVLEAQRQCTLNTNLKLQLMDALFGNYWTCCFTLCLHFLDDFNGSVNDITLTDFDYETVRLSNWHFGPAVLIWCRAKTSKALFWNCSDFTSRDALRRQQWK